MGECSKETVFEILDYFYDNGGNFLDTANNYQNEESEMWIGEWMEKRGVRDQMVVATKVCCYAGPYDSCIASTNVWYSLRLASKLGLIQAPSTAIIRAITPRVCTSVLRPP